ncbi:DNA cytosine methyltransferase [Aristaeella lactis]|uniref:DNA cytosine methyltransferase n=1 Tax=Aristaeella lactis TaxID=3046383 RepID=UPI0009FF4CE6|nr:DNA (cytosine-5-)-methyltransferase [Aristaeella lactis]QUA52190.1 DNA (cytosine-5-)-methyltransferase [Aristaeella lactis]
MYKVVSLFCGCGGADLGCIGGFDYNNQHYERLPYNVIYATDIDKNAVATYKQNFQEATVVCDDICKIKEDVIPDCDIILGGFPCQSFSTVNPTKNPFDARGNLYKEMVRIVKAKKPLAFIAENVKGFMTLKSGIIFKTVVDAFEAAGYRVYSKLVNASHYGVPQKRERCILVGLRKDIVSEYVFPEETTKDNPVPLSVAVRKMDISDKKYYFSQRAVEGMKNARPNMKRGLWQSLDKPCLTVTSHLAKVSLNSRDPVLLVDPEKELYRRFTPREAARIQSFPESFQFVGSDTLAYRQIGNAIAPVMFWYIARELAELLNKQ